jgi:acyl carrier protein
MNTDTASPTTLDAVRSVVTATLGIDEARATAMHAGTELLGSLPELDSMAVVELIYALEERFGVEVDGDEVTADVFETLGSLAAFVETQIA